MEIYVQEIEDIIDATATGPLASDEREKLRQAVRLLLEHVRPEFRNSEKLKTLVKDLLEDQKEGASSEDGAEQPPPKKKRKGHGRRPTSEFTGAQKVPVEHQELHKGDVCPECSRGKLHDTKKPKVLLRVVGSPPIQATAYELQKLLLATLSI
ncbi:MAG: hypothetical protein AB7S38_12860 [Vulcanimicrobiota bacterium]